MTPFFIELDDLVDDLDAFESTALRLSDDLGVAALLFSEEIDVQHCWMLAILGIKVKTLQKKNAENKAKR